MRKYENFVAVGVPELKKTAKDLPFTAEGSVSVVHNVIFIAIEIFPFVGYRNLQIFKVFALPFLGLIAIRDQKRQMVG